MKYIRTKDGKIIDTERYLIGDNVTNKQYLRFYDNLKIKDFELLKSDILEEADTIEELCDEFVFVDNNNNVHYLMDQSILREVKEHTTTDYDDLFEFCKTYNRSLYGAIWTDKGLIYVAKMNGSGELELI